MSEIEYVFGTGDGVVHVWTSAADVELARTGIPDAVGLDFDGDGLCDDVLWDTTGSGVADVAALDLDDDGVLDQFFTDPDGLGTWDHRVTGAAADAAEEPLDWIVRTDPIPDSGPVSNIVSGTASEFGFPTRTDDHDTGGFVTGAPGDSVAGEPVDSVAGKSGDSVAEALVDYPLTSGHRPWSVGDSLDHPVPLPDHRGRFPDAEQMSGDENR